MNAMNGLDAASYQETLNLNNISYDFVMIKATEGTDYVNPSCDLHYQEAKDAGKKRGVYHFTNFGDAIAEANYFVDNCAGYIRDAIFALDWEGEGVANVAWALQFLQQVESRIGYKPAIYMSQYVENTYDWTSVVANDNGLWEAKYSDYEIDNNYDMSKAGQPPVCNHWPFYFMWQWTSKGHLSGYAADLDCDIAYIDAETWDKYAGVNAPTVPVIVPPVTPPTEPSPDPTPVVNPPIVIPPTNPVVVPVTVDPGAPVVVAPLEPITLKEHVWDVLIRSAKTFVAAYTAFIAAGGLNVLHVGSALELKVISLAAIVTAVWNAAIKIYESQV